MTRIVAGELGGRRLEVPQRGTRPTTDRVREALFNALEVSDGLDGARVLDLYAGSGALGLEALSRGAEHVIFVESDRQAANILRRNVGTLGMTGRAQVRNASVSTALSGRAQRPVDVVLADPPYAESEEDLAAALQALVTGGWCVEDAVVVVERPRQAGEPCWPQHLESWRARRYGENVLHWARYTGHVDTATSEASGEGETIAR